VSRRAPRHPWLPASTPRRPRIPCRDRRPATRAM
jgi:hypothetical protein